LLLRQGESKRKREESVCVRVGEREKKRKKERKRERKKEIKRERK